MKYYVLGADNVSRDISIAEFETYDEAYNNLKKKYQNVLDDDGDIECKKISDTSAEIMLYNGDFYYWNLKTSKNFVR